MGVSVGRPFVLVLEASNLPILASLTVDNNVGNPCHCFATLGDFEPLGIACNRMLSAFKHNLCGVVDRYSLA